MRISIITVCYNANKTIERTIKSVLSQEYDNVEYIVIDGASTDGTVDIIKKYSNSIHWISERDTGIYNAMNKGVELASGEIIGFINADDYYFDNNVFTEISSLFSNENCDIVYGDLMLGYPNEMVYCSNSDRMIYNFSEPFPILQPVSFIKAEILKTYRFDQTYKIAADAKWYWQAYIRKYRFRYLNRIISVFSMEGVSSKIENVSVEWKRAALETRELEIERAFHYWRFIECCLEPKCEMLLMEQLSKKCGKNICIVGAGKIMQRMLPYFDKLEINIVGFLDAQEIKINYKGNEYITKSKQQIRLIQYDAVFIASEIYSNVMEDEIYNYIENKRIINFSRFFTDVVSEYIRRRV